jgi:hypothetical protein
MPTPDVGEPRAENAKRADKATPGINIVLDFG